MAFVRQDVWKNGGDFSDPIILWYARGVKSMQDQALADTSSWRFFAGIHGFLDSLWTSLGYLTSTEPLPSKADRDTFWNQCQHQSWYFLPWHRGYLIALEDTIRAAVVKQGGPSDWALPYWNYFENNQLPPAFASTTWPGDGGANPLYVQQRYGPQNNGHVYVPLDQINLKALTDPDFAGVSSGGSPGFGGVDTGFSHSGNVNGGIENQPHNVVHSLVGGGTRRKPGLMSIPVIAGLDPIFYLHHSNIDRLWEVWISSPPPESTGNPVTDSNWMNGPASTGQRGFVMPMPDGTSWTYTPADVQDMSTLPYTYDNLSPTAVAGPSARLLRLGAAAAVANASSATTTEGGRKSMTDGKNVELVGASPQGIRVTGSEVGTSVRLESAPRNRVSASLAAVRTASAAAPPVEPDRVFLNLENVRGTHDAAALKVYVGVPDGANPASYPERVAGSIGLFGVSKASQPDSEHGGQGLTFVLDITEAVDAMHLNNALDVDELPVRIVPVAPIPDEEDITIGRISVFRQGR